MVDDEMKTAEQGEARGTQEGATEVVMDLLAEHVPLTLLADLAVAEPRSEAILAAEGLPDDAWWEDDESPGEGAPTGSAGTGAGARGPEDDLPVDPDAVEDPHPA
ncbi:hypothetical protein [Cellulomonas hominis]|uniref:hypothetical protein n=1 Tax=Cellulomonas hominis TaxID=156981 RepID=UPI001BCB2BA8|nr:hypothetical protein [Cellulomonas hominis]